MKMIRLKDACTGQAKQLIERLPNNSQAYQAARKLLTETYGGLERDVQRYLREARDHPKLKSNDSDSIRSYRNYILCKVRQYGAHSIDKCNMFESFALNERWDKAQALK
jgi:hypothetical protein